MFTLLFAFACGGSLEDRCNEADTYMYRPVDGGHDSKAHIDADGEVCEDIHEGASGIEYTAEAKAACADYIDALETIEQCWDECTTGRDSDEFDSCEDACDEAYTDLPSADAEAAEIRCEMDCPGYAWVCE